MKKSIRYILLLIVVASVLMIGTGCDLFIKTNNGRVDLNWYMKLTYEDANGNDQPYNSNMGQVAAVALESGYADEYGLVVKDEAYLNIDTVKSNIDDRFYWDKKEKLLLFTNANEIYKINIGEKKITSVYAGTTEDIDYNAAIVENEKCFVNMKFVTKFIDMDYSTDEQNGDVPAKVMLSYTIGEKDIMSTTKKIEMRTKGNYQNLIVAVVDKGTKVEVVETGRDWNKVRTNDGFIGYVPVKRLKEEKAKKQEYKSDLEEYTHTTLNKKVSLAWNQIYNQTANNNIDMLMENVKGVNVLSPTWFSICDKLGNLSTLADYTYVEKAHSKGIQV